MDSSIKIPGNTLRETRFDRGVHIVVQILCAIVLLVVIYPLYFIVIASFSDSDMVNTGQVIFYPKGFRTRTNR